MKRFFALILALTMALSCTALAGEFNAGVTFGTDSDGNTTVTVADSDLFDIQKVTLTVSCTLDRAYVVLNGKAVESSLADGTITREQFATILYRYAKAYKGYDVSVGEDTNILSYADAFSISDYAFPALQWACGAGFMNGSGDALMPGGGANRAQAAALFHRFCTLYQD